ncbi:hypothetical protein BC629DRAFT_467615 [Irpex lacteus]|nr:hypothetical protein BC629DRAFT_467615 [Irpex lacteus]
MLTSSSIFFGTCDVLDNPPVLCLSVPRGMCRVLARACPPYEDGIAVWPCLSDAVHVSTATTILATKEQHLRPPLLAQCRQSLQIWVSSLPDHLQFTEDTLEKQIAMFETSSNSGAWCYCYIHTLHPCYVLDLTEAEGRLQAEPIEWIRSQLNAIFRATGNRARNTILSACTIWTYSKYYPHDPQVQIWDDEFEKLWGFRVTLVADQWRKTQSEQRSQIGRTYHVDSVSERDAPPAFAVANSDGSSSVVEPAARRQDRMLALAPGVVHPQFTARSAQYCVYGQ